MAKRTVLIVAYHFPPSSASGSFRMLGFARYLPSQGWRAAVVAPPSMPYEPTDPDLLAQLPPETSVYHVPYLRSRLARKLVPITGWLPRAARACARAIREQRPDAVLTSGPPQQVHLLGHYLRSRHGLPWIADFRDPWLPEGRSSRGRDLASRLIDVQEAAVLRRADAVVANAPGACQALATAYPGLAGKFVTLPNGYDREKFRALAEGLGPRPIDALPRVVHAGAIYFGRDPRPVLDAIWALGRGDGPRLGIAFFGPDPESGLDLAAEGRSRGLGGQLEVGGQVPYARALREMAGADVLLLLDSPGRKVGVPAKIYEYIGAGRPILALGERGGDLEWVLARSGVPYRIAPPADVPAIADGLAALIEARPASSSRRHGPQRFSREAITGRLARLLDHLVERRAGQGGASALSEIVEDKEPAPCSCEPAAALAGRA